MQFMNQQLKLEKIDILPIMHLINMFVSMKCNKNQKLVQTLRNQSQLRILTWQS